MLPATRPLCKPCFLNTIPILEFQGRLIGTTLVDQARMLEVIGAGSVSELVHDIVPASILDESPLKVQGPFSEHAALDRLKAIAERNEVHRNYIGQGYYGTHVPPGHSSQHPRESRLVHRLHALPAGNIPGPPRSAAELPDHGRRPHRPGYRKRIVAGRGDRCG